MIVSGYSDDDIDSGEAAPANNYSNDGELEQMLLKHLSRLSPGSLARVVDRLWKFVNLQEQITS